MPAQHKLKSIYIMKIAINAQYVGLVCRSSVGSWFKASLATFFIKFHSHIYEGKPTFQGLTCVGLAQAHALRNHCTLESDSLSYS